MPPRTALPEGGASWAPGASGTGSPGAVPATLRLQRKRGPGPRGLFPGELRRCWLQSELVSPERGRPRQGEKQTPAS